MSDGVNMDASSTQENSETRRSSSPRQTTSIQELEFGSRSLFGEEAEEKHPIGTENVNKGLTKARAAECDYIGIEQFKPLREDQIKNSSCEQLGPQPEDATMNSNSDQLGLLPEDVAGKNLSSKHAMPGLNHELVPESVNRDTWLGKQKIGTGNFQNGTAETVMVKSHPFGFEQPGPPSVEVTRNSSWDQLRSPPEDESKKYLEQLGLPSDDKAVNTSLEHLELPREDATNNPSKSVVRTSGKSTKEKHALRSSVGSTRVLRSRLQEKSKAPEPSNNMAEHGDGANGEKRMKKRKERQMQKIPVDEFSRIRKHLRYLLNRMSYEQILIDAYSGEGWKGQSLEKIKPDKELQRAKSEILRCKLKIRDLFQRLGLLIAEGRFPESLFDSEGQIDSDDIFCAKCGSRDSPADNDIILCDGACERGFHQFCLEPPLLKEDIPPGDEGWLCPGCDCKVDCINLLNDSQGTNVSILDTGEKVFPEAAVVNKLFDRVGLGFMSDDSEDNDYDPDASELDEKVEGDESSSDESDFYSASEDFGASPNNKQNLEHSSDDSEDDDYDPTALDLDEQVKQETSSSDFTSDSEDFSVAFEDELMSALSDHTEPFGGSDGERSKVIRRKKQFLNTELLSLIESGPSQGDSAPVSGKRHVERLDYEKLYDEAYGNDSCDSSDEDWIDAGDIPKKRRKNNTKKVASAFPSGRTPIIEGTNAKDMQHSQEQSEHTPTRRALKKLDVEGTYNSPAKSHKGFSECGSGDSTTKRSCRRLGEAVTQGLVKSFNENHYPDQSMKEKLAMELGVTVHQVSKWFENARWKFYHPSPQTNILEPGPKMVIENISCNGLSIGNSLTEGSSGQRSTTPGGHKRKSQSYDHQGSE
ncbi:hypothetical protein ACSBR2_021700 [Camellia fascicularis]